MLKKNRVDPIYIYHNPWTILSLLYFQLGEPKKAREAAKKAEEINPELINILEEFLNNSN